LSYFKVDTTCRHCWFSFVCKDQRSVRIRSIRDTS